MMRTTLLLVSLCVTWTGCTQALDHSSPPDAAVPTTGFDAGPHQSNPPTADTAVVATVDGMPVCVRLQDANDPWVDGAPSGSQTLDDQLATGRAAMLGGWAGAVTAPPGFVDPTWLDRLDFYADGTYTAARQEGDEVTAPLYYGDSQRCPPAAWSLSGATSDGLTGSIAVDFWYDTGCALPAWGEGLLSKVRFDVTGRRVRFSFMTGDGYGPIDFDLRRVCLTE